MDHSALVEQIASAFLHEMRGRKFLKYLFDPEPETCGAYGYIDRPFDPDVQHEIAMAVAQAAVRAALSSLAGQGVGE